MIKKLNFDKVDEKVKEFFNKLKANNLYILEAQGKPLVGIVPPWQIKETKKSKKEVLALLRKIWERNRGVSEEQLEKDVTEAITAARKRR